MRRISTITLGIFITLGTMAQDAHFSQYFSAPLYTNPALTGQINGNFRVNALYRSQWNAFSDVFTTSALSFDTRTANNKFGIGVSVVDQVTGKQDFRALNAVLSLSYDLASQSTDHHFIMGLQAGLNSKSMDDNGVTLPDQWEDGLGVINPKNEEFDNLSVLSPELGFGVLWFNGSSVLNVTPFAGAAVYHLIPAKDNFAGVETTLPIRYMLHTGIRYRTNSKVDITPHLMGSFQGQAHNFVGGINFSYGLIDTYVRIEGGISYRYDDAIIPYAGFRWKDFQFGATYDVNTGALSSVGRRKGTLEFSLIYINRKASYKEEYICPRL